MISLDFDINNCFHVNIETTVFCMLHRFPRPINFRSHEQRIMWAIAITWRLLPVTFSSFNRLRNYWSKWNFAVMMFVRSSIKKKSSFCLGLRKTWSKWAIVYDVLKLKKKIFSETTTLNDLFVNTNNVFEVLYNYTPKHMAAMDNCFWLTNFKNVFIWNWFITYY